jgi:hypothetical protein
MVSDSVYNDALSDAQKWREEAQKLRVALDRAQRRAYKVVSVLDELVRLKDGPRDDAYREAKDAAWERARAIVKM